MGDALTNGPLGNPGEPVIEVDPDDLKTFWQKTHNLYASAPGQSTGMTSEAIQALCKPGADTNAVWYRATMLWVLQRFAHDQLASWIENEELPDAVFQTMAMIPMEWIGHDEREGLPFDIEEFFNRLANGSTQNS